MNELCVKVWEMAHAATSMRGPEDPHSTTFYGAVVFGPVLAHRHPEGVEKLLRAMTIESEPPMPSVMLEFIESETDLIFEVTNA